MRTNREAIKPEAFASLPKQVREKLAKHLGGVELTASRLFDGLAALSFSYLQTSVEEEGDLENRLIQNGLSAELGSVFQRIADLETAVNSMSPADWKSLTLLDEFASRSVRDKWRERALCLNLDIVDFFDAFWMRTLEISQTTMGVKNGRGRRLVRTGSFDELADSIVQLWIGVTNSPPTWTKNTGGLLVFVNDAAEHITGSVALKRFTGKLASAKAEQFQHHYVVERTMVERHASIRAAAKVGLLRWKSAEAGIKSRKFGGFVGDADV